MSSVKSRTLYEATKRLEISASHVLPNVSPDNPCSRVHGHNYFISVTFVGYMLDTDTGMLVNFDDVDAIIKGKYDHRSLNDVIKGSPTAEMLAHDISREMMAYLFKTDSHDVVRVARVTVAETRDSEATVIMQYSEDL